MKPTIIYSLEDWKKRAEAAEKTAHILKNKVMDLYNNGGQTAINKQLEKAKSREEANRRKRELMEVRNQELKKYSENLEGEVAARTEDIKTILNNVKFGFLVIDQNLQIGEEYTRSCHELFKQEKIGGISFPELFQMAQREKEHFQLGIDQVFEDFMPPEVTLGQMHSRFVLGDRIIKAEGSVIRKNEAISHILYTISDITQLEAAQREAASNRVLIGILKQKDAFVDFLLEAKELLKRCKTLVNEPDQNVLRRLVHTLKGNSASWDLLDIAKLIHSIEEAPRFDGEHIQRIDDGFRQFINEHSKVIAIEYDELGDGSFEISTKQIDHLKQIIANLDSNEAHKLKTWTSKVLQKPVGSLLGPIDEFVEKLGARLGKELNFSFTGQDTLVDVGSMKYVFQNLIHLLRNSVDHGIEEPMERSGKPAVGHVNLEVRADKQNYYIEVSDDGRGIDTEKLKKKATQKGLMTTEQAKALSLKEQYELIFLDGLSSTDEATDVSGRGVGMSAMLEAVKAVYGTFDISSELGKGTKMRITIPLPELMVSRLRSVG